jgi:hypothetical protein
MFLGFFRLCILDAPVPLRNPSCGCCFHGERNEKAQDTNKKQEISKREKRQFPARIQANPPPRIAGEEALSR